MFGEINQLKFLQQLEMIEKLEKEKQETKNTNHVTKKTHKGEIEVNEEDLSTLEVRKNILVGNFIYCYDAFLCCNFHDHGHGVRGSKKSSGILYYTVMKTNMVKEGNYMLVFYCRHKNLLKGSSKHCLYC